MNENVIEKKHTHEKEHKNIRRKKEIIWLEAQLLLFDEEKRTPPNTKEESITSCMNMRKVEQERSNSLYDCNYKQKKRRTLP